MSNELVETNIVILGRIYQIKCPASEVSSLQHSARYLEEKMRSVRGEANNTNIERMAVITALNVVHQLLSTEQQKESHMLNINQRLHDLQTRIETALIPTVQMELQPAE
jgi:cell division protein ZapA